MKHAIFFTHLHLWTHRPRNEMSDLEFGHFKLTFLRMFFLSAATFFWHYGYLFLSWPCLIKFSHASSFTVLVFKMGLTILVAQPVFIFRAKLWKVVVKCEFIFFRGWTFCSFLFARYFLLVARYFLLVARYFLLVACYFLLVAAYFLLVARYFLFIARYFLFIAFSQLLWAIARLLVTRVIITYLVGEFFIFSFLVLLKEIRTRGDFKISFSCFCVSYKSRELGGRWVGRGRGSPRFSCLTPAVESFLRSTSSYNKLLGRVAFKILSNIHDGALLRK